MNRPDFTVSTLGELATLYTAEIAEGANVWVGADGAYWTLEKNSGAALSPTVIAPGAGAPIAGATNARWIRDASAPGVPESGATIVYRPGAVGVLPPNVVATWPLLMALFNVIAGPVRIAIDDSLAPTVVTAGVSDFQGRATFFPYKTCNLAGNVTFDITDGATLLNVSGFDGGGLYAPGTPTFRVIGHSSVGGVFPLAFSGPSRGNVLRLSNGVYILNASGIPVPMIGQAALDSLVVFISDESKIEQFFSDTPATATLTFYATSGAIILNGALSGVGTVTLNYDSSVEPRAQATLTALTRQLMASGIVFGSTTLVAGVSPAIPALGLSAASAIVPGGNIPTPGAGALTRQYAALGSDRVYTAGAESFKMTALLADGTINVLDTSKVDYIVFR